MKSSWFDGVEVDQHKELRGDFISSRLTRNRLKKMLEDKIKTSQSSLRKKDVYDKPNFGVIAADSIGYERAMIEVMSLIETDEK